jgi:hypothetical protein
MVWSTAKRHVGDYVRVRGGVVKITTARGERGKPTFLDLGHAYPNRNRFTAVVWNKDREDMLVPWPEEARFFLGKEQCFEGRVYLYRGVPNMRVSLFDWKNNMFVE